MTTLTIPTSIDEIDRSWLTAALGTEVDIASPPERLSSFACEVFRIRLTGAGAPPGVIVKLPIPHGPVRQLVDSIGAYQREVAFYRTLAGEAPLRTPRAYVAQMAEAGSDFILVLEDLAPLSSPDQLVGLSLRQAEVAVDEIARFHAWSWESPRLDALAATFLPIGSEPGRALQQQWAQFFSLGWPVAADLAGEDLTDALRHFGEHYSEHVTFFVDELSTPRVLSHGELRADNMILDGEDRPYVIDFQNMQQECGPRELAYFLAQSLTTEVRRGNDEMLVRRYWSQLTASGVSDYPWEEAWRQYRLGLASVAVMTVCACMRYADADPRGQRLLAEMVKRIFRAIVDNDSLALLPPSGSAAGGS